MALYHQYDNRKGADLTLCTLSVNFTLNNHRIRIISVCCW